jgi:cytidine deaminase
MPILLVPKDHTEDDANATDTAEAKVVTMTVEALLPLSFGPEHLPKN